MLRFLATILILALISAVPVGLQAEDELLPTATIIGFRMMHGDNADWSEPDFDSRDWKLSQTPSGSGFNRVAIPNEIGWLRSESFPLPKYFTDHPGALYVVTGASFQVFWNGVMIGENGRPGPDATTEEDGLTDTRFYIQPQLILDTGNVLAFRYSAHGYRRLRLPLAIEATIGPYQDVRYNRLRAHIPALLLLGAVGAACIFHFTLFLRRRVDRGSLWLGLMFLMVAVQAASEISRAAFSYSYLGMVARIIFSAIFAFGSGLFLNLFILTYLGLSRFKPWILLFTHILAAIAILLYFSHFDKLTFAFIAIFILSALGLTICGLMSRRQGTLPLLLVLTVFCVSLLSGPTAFLDNYYYVSMALLAATLFVLQANAISRSEQRSIEETLRSNRLELDLVKWQIQPHFIMNTLTALSEWIITDPKSGVDMINVLADEFRILNDHAGKKLVSLESELNLCRSHLSVMSFRQNQSFSLEAKVQTLGLRVPPAIFHTIVENALTHKRYTNDETVFLFEQKETEVGDVVFTLTAPPGTKARRGSPSTIGRGVGLSYIEARLEEAWPNSFTLDYSEDIDGRWLSTIIVRSGALG